MAGSNTFRPPLAVKIDDIGEIVFPAFDSHCRSIATGIMVSTKPDCGCDRCSWMSETKQQSLLTFLSGCTSMREFCIDSGVRFPVPALTEIVSQHSSMLAKIGIFNPNSPIGLVGDRDEYVELAKAVETQCPSLETVVVEFLVTELPGSAVADPFITSLLNITTMTRLELGASNLERLENMISPMLLVEACQSIHLCRLYIDSIQETTAIAMMSALETNQHLEELIIDCFEEWSKEGALSGAQLIRSNRKLKCLKLGRDFQEVEGIWELLFSLKASPTIEDFALSACLRHVRLAREAIADMFQENTTLTGFSMGYNDTVLHREIQYYLKLNRAGRGRLDPSSPKLQLVNALAEVNTDVSCLFYFLSRHPTLFHLTDPRVARLSEENPRKRRRRYRAVKYNRISYR